MKTFNMTQKVQTMASFVWLIAGLLLILTLIPNFRARAIAPRAASSPQIDSQPAPSGSPDAFLPSINLGQSPTALLAPRKYYATAVRYQGDRALLSGICEAGYHMASMWEILNPSVLEYEKSLGYTTADSGLGPPSDYMGWIRTGYTSESQASAGRDNCGAWTMSDGQSFGTIVGLEATWSGTTVSRPIYPWVSADQPCDQGAAVWCIQD